MSWKRPLFAVATVALFFAVVEIALWAAGVRTLLSERDPFSGFSERVRVFELDENRGVYRTPRRAVAHSFNYQEFAAEKQPNGFRLFVLGGSSAYGFPWGGGVAFPRVLGDALQAAWPERAVESVNAAAMSYGSHRLRILAREVLEYEPDVLIIYGGHNEFVERRFYRDVLERPPEVDPLRLLLHRWRLFSVAARFHDGTVYPPKPGETSTAELLGLDVVREHSVNVGDAEKSDVEGLFRDNLRVILDLAESRGVPVLLCTVPSNLAGWVPNQSEFGADVDFDDRREVLDLLARARAGLEMGEAASAIVNLGRAVSLSPGYAETHYVLGKAHEALGHWAEAGAAYVRARDTDSKPTRATSAINDAVRGLARQRGAILVDIERALADHAPHGLLGFDLIQDYVHPKPEGHRLIAMELWKVIQERGLLGEVRRADDGAFRAALAEADRADVPAAPFDSKAPALVYNLAVVLENQGLPGEAMERYRECRDMDPRFFVEAGSGLARLLAQERRFAEAAEEYRRVLDVEPGHMKSLLGLGEALRQLKRLDSAAEALRRATDADPRSAAAWDGYGVVLAEQARYTEAESAFRRAVTLDPDDPGRLANLGFALLFQSRTEDAEAAFRASLELRADHIRARDGLATVLTERGALDEAERIFRENLRVDPDDAYARNGLAVIERRRR